MTHDVLITALAGALTTAFLLGWLAGWLTLRAARPRQRAGARIEAARHEADAARRALTEAMIEIDELRAYIDQRLATGSGASRPS